MAFVAFVERIPAAWISGPGSSPPLLTTTKYGPARLSARTVSSGSMKPASPLRSESARISRSRFPREARKNRHRRGTIQGLSFAHILSLRSLGRMVLRGGSGRTDGVNFDDNAYRQEGLAGLGPRQGMDDPPDDGRLQHSISGASDARRSGSGRARRAHSGLVRNPAFLLEPGQSNAGCTAGVAVSTPLVVVCQSREAADYTSETRLS